MSNIRSRAVTLGVIAAGVVALSATTTLPADAATRYWTVQGTGQTPAAAKKNADNKCTRAGGHPDPWAGYVQTSGGWTATEQCSA
ncbi:hypothetical protein [Streptomyces sp. V2]|uniref:hypothetical protein n=1 Tax=Streptomyces sp. V2 TaxID=1424099 RepID=UPI0010577954|nr:hypothetical protein [Streptomyces sp. V2]